MKKLAFLGGAFGLGVGALLVAHSTQAADHIDSPGAIANPMADITDVYAWNTSDKAKLNLIMNVSPGDPGTRSFDSSVQYVFHVSSTSAIDSTTRTETKVICTFASDTDAQCWVAGASVKDYVHGDPSNTSGMTSADGKVKVFAGRRADPFFFNLNGFKDLAAYVAANGGSLTTDAAGCPNLGPAQGQALRGMLAEGPRGSNTHAPCTGSSSNCFEDLNVMSVVVQVDLTLLNEGTNKVLAVWGSTHAAPQ